MGSDGDILLHDIVSMVNARTDVVQRGVDMPHHRQQAFCRDMFRTRGIESQVIEASY
ncbi:MAG: hypothetical protein J1E57_03025 [Prevotella sp.]|nr:hypothetical protein [Prevotella sp.]